MYKLGTGSRITGLYAPRVNCGGPILWEIDDTSYLIHANSYEIPLKSLVNHEKITNKVIIDALKTYHNIACLRTGEMAYYFHDNDYDSGGVV